MLSYQVFKYIHRNQTVFFFFFPLAQLVAISSISTTQLLTPGSGGSGGGSGGSRNCRQSKANPISAPARLIFDIFTPFGAPRPPEGGVCVCVCVGGRTTMGGVMIRFAVSECAPDSGCLLGNLLDYFHLIRPCRLGRGCRGSPEAGCCLRGDGGSVRSLVCVFSACGMLTGEDGEGKNRVTLKVRRREGSGGEE